MYLADTLSRAVCAKQHQTNLTEEAVLQTRITQGATAKHTDSIIIASSLSISMDTLASIQRATAADNDLQQPIPIIQEG